MSAESRSVVVRLSMEAAQYIREAQRVGAVGAGAMSKVEAAAHRSSAAYDDLGRDSGRVALLAAAGFGIMVGAAARFDKGMSAVQAATHETTGNMGQLRLAALEAGKETVYSATESAAAIEELAKAGIQTTDILGGGLKGSLNLAAAGNLEVARAAEISASALTQFNLAGSDVPHVADLLAAGAGKAQGSVEDLGMALNQSGLVAAQTGLSIEETTAALASFASAGLTGSDAGTSFKTMLLALNPQSKQARDLMDELGFSAYDSQGQFVGLEELARRLQGSLAGMSDEQRNAALQTLFGRDAIRAANVLYKEGEQGVKNWTAAVDDQGYAAETAATRLDNLSGDLERFKGSVETFLIGGGEGAQGQLRGIVKGATAVVDALSGLPPAAQGALTGIAAIGTLTAGGLWLGSKVVSKVSGFNTSLATLGETSPKAARGLRLLASAGTALLALEVAGAIFETIEAKAVGAAPSVERLTAALIAANEAEFNAQFGADLAASMSALDASGIDGIAQDIDNLADKAGALGSGLEHGLGTFIPGIGNELSEASEDTARATQAFESLDAALAGLVASGGPERAQEAFASLAASQGLSTAQQRDLLKLLPSYNEALTGSANAATLAAEEEDKVAGATKRSGRAHEVTKEQVKALREAYQDEVVAAHDTADAFLDISATADDAKVSLREWIAQMEAQDRALENFTANTIKAGKRGLRDGLIKYLQDLGPTGALRMKQLANATEAEIERANRAWKRGQDAAEGYEKATVIKPAELKVIDRDIKKVDVARQKFETFPKSTSTEMRVDNDQALAGARAVQAAIDRLHDKTITLRTVHQDSRLEAQGAGGSGGGGGGGNDDFTAYGANERGLVGSTYSTSRGVPAYKPSPKPRRDLVDVFGNVLQNLADIVDGHSKKINKAFNQFEPSINKGADQVRAEVRELRQAIREAGGNWTKAMEEETDRLINLAEKRDTQKAIAKGLRQFEVDVSQGADGVQQEVRDLRHAIKEAGGVWNAALSEQSEKLIETATAYDLATQSLASAQGQLDSLLADQVAYSQQVSQVFNTSPFGTNLASFDQTVGGNTASTGMFTDVLQQLAGQGLDGDLFKELASSGDLKTAIQLLATGPAGIAMREEAFAAMLQAQQDSGGFAAGQVFGADRAAAEQAVRDNVIAVGALTAQLEQQEKKFDRMVSAVESLPRQTRDGAETGTYRGAKEGIQAIATSAGREKARSGS